MVEAALRDFGGTRRGRRQAIGYVCLGASGDGELGSRSSAISACCDERGLLLSRIVHDVDAEGRDVRPSLVWALEQLAEGRVDVLVLTRLHDLSANPGEPAAVADVVQP